MQKHSCPSNSSSQSLVATEYANDLYAGLLRTRERFYTSPRLCFTSQDRAEFWGGGDFAAPSLQPVAPPGSCDVADGGGESIIYYISLVCVLGHGAFRSLATHHPCVRACVQACECRVDKSTAAAAAAKHTVRETNDEFDFIVSHTIAPAMRPARALPGLARLHVHPPCGKTHDTRLALALWQPALRWADLILCIERVCEHPPHRRRQQRRRRQRRRLLYCDSGETAGHPVCLSACMAASLCVNVCMCVCVCDT